MTVNPRALIKVAHTVEPGTDIRLYPVIPVLFVQLVASLYPKLASTVSVKKGYCAFAKDGRFIGTMSSTGLTSIRRNPLLKDDSQLFLRALLGGLYLKEMTACSMYCDWDNYGTLRLMQKLGLGARPERSGHRSTLASPETEAYLRAAIDKARIPYSDHRAYAMKKLAGLERPEMFLPIEGNLDASPISLDVTLL